MFKKNKSESRTEKENAANKKLPKAEGQLSIDFYQTDSEFVIQSTIAGVSMEDLNISAENGILTIKGSRKKPESKEEKKYIYRECYWGSFSRQIVLPEEVNIEKSQAEIKNGVLILRLPKDKKEKLKISIKNIK